MHLQVFGLGRLISLLPLVIRGREPLDLCREDFLSRVLERYTRYQARFLFGSSPERGTFATEIERLSQRSKWHRIPDRDQIWAAPPSTNNSVPVTKALSSEARKTTALAISSGVPKRPMGTRSTILANICWPAGPDCASRS